MAKKATKVDPTESKSDKTKRVALPRVKKVIAGLTGLSKMGTTNYEWDQEDVAKAKKAIKDSFDRAFEALENPGGKPKSDEFEF